MRGQSLRQLYEGLGPRGCVHRLKEMLASGELKAAEYSLRETAEACCGPDWVRRLHPRAQMDSLLDPEAQLERAVMEAGGGAVDVSAFRHITGQIIFSEIHQGWKQVGNIGESISTNRPTRFDGEKIPGVAIIGSVGTKVHPGMPYPTMGFGEHYFQTPSTDKDGLICEVTKEAVFFDRTNLVLDHARMVGERLARKKEKQILATLAGVSITIEGETFDGNNHSWNGTTYNTYSTTANAIGINSKSGVELQDWTDVEEAALLFADLLHPDTGDPIDMDWMGFTIVTTPFKAWTLQRIRNATQLASLPGGYATSGTPQRTEGGNIDVIASARILSSALLYKVIQDSGVSAADAKHWWFAGNPNAAIRYMENWPLTTVEAPANNEAEFTRDVVFRAKASERGVPFMFEPRKLTKLYSS